MAAVCEHLDTIRAVHLSADGCEGCLQSVTLGPSSRMFAL